MEKSHEVTGTVIPVARNDTVKTLAEKEINSLGKEDLVTVRNGADNNRIEIHWPEAY
jgi:hypothetical protein